MVVPHGSHYIKLPKKTNQLDFPYFEHWSFAKAFWKKLSLLVLFQRAIKNSRVHKLYNATTNLLYCLFTDYYLLVF